MNHMTSWRALVGTAVLLTSAACVDLDVTNPNEPERDRALASAADVESLISGQFRSYWDLVQGSGDGDGSAAATLDALAEAEVSNSANDGTQDAGNLPPAPLPNIVGYRWGNGWRTPWLVQNRGLAAIREGLQAAASLNLQFEEPERIDAFAKFMQGVFHGQIALLYDRGLVIDETIDDVGALPLVPYGEVMAAARGYLSQARATASDNSFTIPAGWLGPAAYTNDDLVELTHSYEARFMAQVARDPTERAAVDWAGVIMHVDNGITQDFGADLDGPGGVWGSSHKGRSGQGNSVGLSFLGPADQSGAYIDWEDTPSGDRQPFDIDTDDRRINDGTINGPGALVEWRGFFNNQPERGTYYLSNYSPLWYRQIDETGFGFAPEISVVEMEFLKAEGNIRLGSPELALPIINDQRTTLGELPAATVDGVVGQNRCVPRSIGPLAKANPDASIGDCGDLMTTLIYEKRMAVYLLSVGSIFYDARGFGVVRTGRAIHLPIPAEDLQLMPDEEIYTFGGGGPGSAS